MAKAEAAPTAVAVAGSRWPSALRWIPTSAGSIAAAEKRLLSLVKTGYVQEQVNIGSAPLGSKARWFKSSEEPRFINTVTFDSGNENAPTLVMVHGYGASQGLFFRNYDALASRFRVIAIDQLGWGGSSRPDFICKCTEDYIYHTSVAKASGELCLNYTFSLGAFARKPILQSASDWKVSTTFIYGHDDWMNYQGAQQARKYMTVPCEIIRVPHGGHLKFIDNPSGFNSAVLYACRNFLSADVGDNLSRPDGLIFA